MAVWTPWIDVSRSSTICEIATFMTLVSSTITNWAEASMKRGIHLRMPERTLTRAGVAYASPRRRWRDTGGEAMNSSDSVGTVQALWRFPVKSMQGEQLDAADLDAGGIAGD